MFKKLMDMGIGLQGRKLKQKCLIYMYCKCELVYREEIKKGEDWRKKC